MFPFSFWALYLTTSTTSSPFHHLAPSSPAGPCKPLPALPSLKWRCTTGPVCRALPPPFGLLRGNPNPPNAPTARSHNQADMRVSTPKTCFGDGQGQIWFISNTVHGQHLWCQLPVAPPGGVFSCNQFSPGAVFCQAYAQSSSCCEAVWVRRPMYIFSSGQRRVTLCHHCRLLHAPKAHGPLVHPFHLCGVCVRSLPGFL